MDPAEVEFIAEREPIKIVPKFNAGKIYLLQGDYGPFKAGLTTEVYNGLIYLNRGGFLVVRLGSTRLPVMVCK